MLSKEEYQHGAQADVRRAPRHYASKRGPLGCSLVRLLLTKAAPQHVKPEGGAQHLTVAVLKPGVVGGILVACTAVRVCAVMSPFRLPLERAGLVYTDPS